MSITIRNTVMEDEAMVVELWRSCNLVASYNNPETDFRFATANCNSAVLVAERVDGFICGTVMVGHDGHRGRLYYVASAPEHWGQGIGRTMIKAGEQ